MSNEIDWLLDLGIKDSDYLTFEYRGENSYKYKNFKQKLDQNIKILINQSLHEKMRASNVIIDNYSWIDGIPCELFQNGLEKKGKIRLKVTIEFVPDEVEVPKDSVISSDERSPLDDIRQVFI